MLMCAVNKMLTQLCHLCLSLQYYEMSYGLNIEMHKQVRNTIFAMFFVCFFLSFTARLRLVHMQAMHRYLCVCHFLCRSCIY